MNIIEVHYIYMYKNSLMKTIKTDKTKGEEGERLRKSDIPGANLIKVHYIHL
jgi:hypothetical protein